MSAIQPLNDRAANRRELRAVRNFILGCEGPGITRAAARLGINPGYLSQLLRGQRNRRLTLRELRLLRQPYCEAPTVPAVSCPEAGI